LQVIQKQIEPTIVKDDKDHDDDDKEEDKGEIKE
jgi:hypothetical protein